MVCTVQMLISVNGVAIPSVLATTCLIRNFGMPYFVAVKLNS
jgi:hypothetical protein